MIVFHSPRTIKTVLASLALSVSLAQAAVAQEASAQCGAASAAQYEVPAPVPAADGTVNVETPFGAAELPTAPGRALGMYTTDVDILIWLGFPLASQQPIRGDSGYTTFPCFFPQAALANVTAFGNYPEYNFEQILLAEPDFILNGLGYDTEVNERLPQIAPTYSLNAYDGSSWQDHFQKTATDLGRLEQYEAWYAIYLQRVAEVRELIKANADAIVAPVSYWDGKFNSGCYTSVQCTVFNDLGLTIYEGALEKDGEGVEIAPEGVSAFKDIDYVFTTIGVGETALAEHATQMAELNKNPLWAQLDFVKQGHVVPYEMEIVYGSPSGQLAFLEVVAEALGQ